MYQVFSSNFAKIQIMRQTRDNCESNSEEFLFDINQQYKFDIDECSRF